MLVSKYFLKVCKTANNYFYYFLKRRICHSYFCFNLDFSPLQIVVNALIPVTDIYIFTIA